MIEINLLPGAKRKRGGKGRGLTLPDFTALLATVKDPWLVAAIASWVLVLGAGGPFYFKRQAQVRTLEPQVESALRDSTHYAKILISKRRLVQRRGVRAAGRRALAGHPGAKPWQHCIGIETDFRIGAHHGWFPVLAGSRNHRPVGPRFASVAVAKVLKNEKPAFRRACRQSKAF